MAGLLGGCALGSALLSRAGLAIGPGRPDFGDADTIFRGDYPLDEPGAIVLSTCLGCHGACPVRISREGGVLAKIDGSPWSPRVFEGPLPSGPGEAAGLRGALCARGQARLQNTHDPYRLVEPLAREGARGAGGWSRLAPSQLAAALEAAAEGDLFVGVDPRQQDRQAVLAAFQGANPRVTVHLGTSYPWLVEASAAMTGEPGWILQPRMERAHGVLLWGSDAVASGPDPVGDTLALSRLRGGHRHGLLVVVDPRLSIAAGMADIWLPVRPGGDTALAWMLLRAWREAGHISETSPWLEQALQWPWRHLEQQSGLGGRMVRRAAEALAELGSGLAVRVGGGVGERPGGASATEAILRLAALGGATAPGGAMEPLRRAPSTGRRADLALHERLLDGGAIELLLLAGDGGVLGSPHQAELMAALADPRRVRLLVVSASTMNQVAGLADIVIPDTTEHERDGLVQRWDGSSLVRPALPSILSETGLPAPWDRGLDGLLESIAQLRGSDLDCEAALQQAIVASGQADALAARGWVPAAETAGPPPEVDPYRPDAARSPAEPVEGLAFLTYREAFGGFPESTAQYWSTPSLRRQNAAWMHQATAEELGIQEGETVLLGYGELLQRADVQLTEGIRPGAVAAALGYGQGYGFDGRITIDGAPVPPDPRRQIGFDAGQLWSLGDRIRALPGGPRPLPSFEVLLAPPSGDCARI